MAICHNGHMWLTFGQAKIVFICINFITTCLIKLCDINPACQMQTAHLVGYVAIYAETRTKTEAERMMVETIKLLLRSNRLYVLSWVHKRWCRKKKKLSSICMHRKKEKKEKEVKKKNRRLTDNLLLVLLRWWCFWGILHQEISRQWHDTKVEKTAQKSVLLLSRLFGSLTSSEMVQIELSKSIIIGIFDTFFSVKTFFFIQIQNVQNPILPLHWHICGSQREIIFLGSSFANF